jgi:Mlo family
VQLLASRARLRCAPVNNAGCDHTFGQFTCALMQVGDDFDFASFVSDFLTEEFSKIVKLEFLMWVLAIVWIAFPDGSYAGFWMTGIFVLLSVTAGGKLHVIAMHLARHAYSLYYVPVGDDTSVDLSGSGGAEGGAEGPDGSRTASGGERGSRSEERLTAVLGPDMVPTEAAPARRLSGVEEGHAARRRSGADASTTRPQPATDSPQPIAEGRERGRRNGSASDLTNIVEGKVMQEGMPTDVVRSGSHERSSSNKSGGQSPGEPSPPEAGANRPDGSRDQLELHAHQCGCVPCHWHRRHGHTVQGRLNAGGAPGSSPSRGLRLGRDRKGRPNQSTVQFQKLFWFQSPRLMLRVFQYAYFENALVRGLCSLF